MGSSPISNAIPKKKGPFIYSPIDSLLAKLLRSEIVSSKQRNSVLTHRAELYSPLLPAGNFAGDSQFNLRSKFSLPKANITKKTVTVSRLPFFSGGRYRTRFAFSPALVENKGSSSKGLKAFGCPFHRNISFQLQLILAFLNGSSLWESFLAAFPDDQ